MAIEVGTLNYPNAMYKMFHGAVVEQSHETLDAKHVSEQKSGGEGHSSVAVEPLQLITRRR